MFWEVPGVFGEVLGKVLEGFEGCLGRFWGRF